MVLMRWGHLLAAMIVAACACSSATGKTMSEVLAGSKPTDWRTLEPQNTLYIELEKGRIVMELAQRFAPGHADNIRAMVRNKYFDGMGINRVQDNFVVQWGDPEKPLGDAQRTLPPEFTRSAVGLSFTALPDPDAYAPQVGFVEGFPAARESTTGAAWPVHCYGTVGAGRDNAADSGGGTELYVVIGHSPRQLDRNITVVGRIVQGMELLSVLSRGPVPMGFYEKDAPRTAIKSIRVMADVPVAERVPLEVLRTDTATFAELVEARRNRRDEWYKVPAGRIDVCNVPLPVRVSSLEKSRRGAFFRQ
jgi:peptidylprolyl isomerase